MTPPAIKTTSMPRVGDLVDWTPSGSTETIARSRFKSWRVGKIIGINSLTGRPQLLMIVPDHPGTFGDRIWVLAESVLST
jgi:hypothetical protein